MMNTPSSSSSSNLDEILKELEDRFGSPQPSSQSNAHSSTKKKKSKMKTMLGALAFFVAVAGAAAGLSLGGQPQDPRQQASEITSDNGSVAGVQTLAQVPGGSCSPNGSFMCSDSAQYVCDGTTWRATGASCLESTTYCVGNNPTGDCYQGGADNNGDGVGDYACVNLLANNGRIVIGETDPNDPPTGVCNSTYSWLHFEYNHWWCFDTSNYCSPASTVPGTGNTGFSCSTGPATCGGPGDDSGDIGDDDGGSSTPTPTPTPPPTCNVEITLQTPNGEQTGTEFTVPENSSVTLRARVRDENRTINNVRIQLQNITPPGLTITPPYVIDTNNPYLGTFAIGSLTNTDVARAKFRATVNLNGGSGTNACQSETTLIVTRTGASPTPTPSPSSTPRPTATPRPVCTSISMRNLNEPRGGFDNKVNVNDPLTFTCGNVSGATRYEFMLIKPDYSVQTLETTTQGGRTTKPYIVPEAGEYSGLCRPCFGGSFNEFCSPWENGFTPSTER